MCQSPKEKVKILSQFADELVQQIESLPATSYSEHPRKIYPDCPEDPPPPYRKVCHPYLKGQCMLLSPSYVCNNSKVTVDGLLASPFEPKKYFFEPPPPNVPPWFRPRYNSFELRGGRVMQGCLCWRKNGLQDECPRWDCIRPACNTKPLPECPPAINAPICGIRKKNAMICPLFPSTRHRPGIPPKPPGDPEKVKCIPMAAKANQPYDDELFNKD